MQDIIEYRANLIKEVNGFANTSGFSMYQSESFTDFALEVLTEADVLDNPLHSHYKSSGVSVDAYDFDDEIKTLKLIVTRYEGIDKLPNLIDSEIKKIYKRLENFYIRSTKGLHEKMNQAAEANDLALLIHQYKDEIKNVEFILITDLVCKKKPGQIIQLSEETEAILSIWDIQRFFNYQGSGRIAEEIVIDFKDYYSDPINVSMVPSDDGKYKIFLGVINGQLLYNLYNRWGTRLLERNVRAFLQVRRRSVNSEIRITVNEEPEMFMAYNNGLTITSNKIKFIEKGNNIVEISQINDFQIVNGGQTIASIWHTKHKNKDAEISKLNVQMKIVSIEDKKDIEHIAKRISYTSNRQNAVNTADFSANDPYHICLEKFSRNEWAPDPTGGNIEAKWFYERARGLYQETKNLERTESLKNRWAAIYPKEKTFNKLIFAKAMQTFYLKPHIVSSHGQKNFKDFMVFLKEENITEIDQFDYYDIIAKIIIWKKTEKIISAQKIPGYRVNIVTYTLALISYLIQGRLNFMKIWKQQDISEELAEIIDYYGCKVREHIVDTESNVGEYCKKESVWDTLKHKFKKDVIWKKIEGDLVDSSKAKKPPKKTKAQTNQIKKIKQYNDKNWWALAKWGKSTNLITPKQRSQSANIAKRLSRKQEISGPLAFAGEEIIKKAKKMGFKPENLKNN